MTGLVFISSCGPTEVSETHDELEAISAAAELSRRYRSCSGAEARGEAIARHGRQSWKSKCVVDADFDKRSSD